MLTGYIQTCTHSLASQQSPYPTRSTSTTGELSSDLRNDSSKCRHPSTQLPHSSALSYPAPCTLHPTPYTLHPTSCRTSLLCHTLRPAPCTLHPTPYTLNPQLVAAHLCSVIPVIQSGKLKSSLQVGRQYSIDGNRAKDSRENCREAL